jgi:hypothetical protein
VFSLRIREGRVSFSLLGASTFDEKINTAIISLFFLRCEVAAGKFASLAMIMQALTAQRMLGATFKGANAVLRVDFRPRALILFTHEATSVRIV